MEKQRLDYLVAQKLGVSRSSAVNLIENNKVAVNGKVKEKPSARFSATDNISISETVQTRSRELKIKIIHEDKNCIVIEKPAGVLAHSKGAFSTEATIASWLLPRTTGFEHTNNRAGIVHRLDRSTSGVMICAKNPEALVFLQKQFSIRKVKKEYVAMIEKELEPAEAIIDLPIERNPKDPKRFRASANGKPAQTTYSTIRTFRYQNRTYSLIKLQPRTGRTHQLRVHLAYMKRPIVGDDFYGGAKADRLYLHATKLELTLPNGQRQGFESDLPTAFLKPNISNDE